jgi:peptide/nickel transport system ATP-binding protein
MEAKNILTVQELSVAFGPANERKEVVHRISFELRENEIMGVVGESGSGKSVSFLAITGLLPKKTSGVEGVITFDGKDLKTLTERAMRQIRGKEIGMIFQEPMSALNPSMRCGKQVSEMLRLHLGLSANEARARTIELFKQVRLPEPERIYRRYPHQISGGQMQRVMIAMAISCKPKLLIADEPTTALDVTVQKEIVELLKDLQKETGMSMVFISHDLALVSEIADRVMVMYHGNVVEQGSLLSVFKLPRHDYTKALLKSRPELDKRLERLPTIRSLEEGLFEPKEIGAQERARRHKKLYTRPPLLEVRNLSKTYFSRSGIFDRSKPFKAVDQVSFKVFEGETLGLVGESGCGKSTLSKAIMLLDPPSGGEVYYNGKRIDRLNAAGVKKLRREIQLIFQDPFSSLNPRMTIGEAVSEPMKVHTIEPSARKRRKMAGELLLQVGLDESFYNRYPHELSGGQRQRVGIARAIAVRPKLVVCDESVSALDISVQAQVLNLLNALKENYGFTYIFISHDLAVVKYMSDQLMVMNQGKIEEMGDADEVYASPKSPYTQKLIEAIPKGL